MTVLAMSRGEISRFDTLMRVDRGGLRVADAATLLGLKRRQIFRLLERLRADGAAGVVSRKRGRPSNRRHSDVLRDKIITIVREHCHDFGPALAGEYPDGRLEIRHEEHALPYRIFDKIRQVNQAAIVENKHLDAALMMATLMQEQLLARKRNNNEPCRRSQPHHLFPSLALTG